MRKYYTIEKTLHTNKESLLAMISATTSMRKNLEPEKNFDGGENFLAGKNSQKKIARRANI